MVSMRKRKNRVEIKLNDAEYEHLNRLVQESNLSRESFLRMIINGLLPKPSPSKELIEVIFHLRTIAETLNQIAVHEYELDNTDLLIYMQNYEYLQEQITEIMLLIRHPTTIQIQSTNR